MASNQQRPKVRQIPTPLALAETQYQDTLQQLERGHDPAHFRWESAAELIGPMLPGHLWTVGARPANGKTTFLLNVFHGLVEAQIPTLYLTTETTAEEMHRVWAAMVLGYDQDQVLEQRWDKLPADAKARLQVQLELQTRGIADLGLFVDLPKLDKEHVGTVLKTYALHAGYKFIILDHIHRWHVKEQSNKTAELTEAVQGLKGWATKYHMTVMLAAQINRGLDRSPLAEFLPPPLSGLQQTSALEQESNVVLMLHRLRKKSATTKEAKEVNLGQRDVLDLIEPDVMCVSVAKHRHRRRARGRTFKLMVRDNCALEELTSFDLARMGLLDLPPVDEGTAQEPELPF